MFNRDNAETIFNKLSITPHFAPNSVIGWVVLDGRKECLLRYTNGNFEMSDSIARTMRDNLRLNTNEFNRLHECTLQRDAYLGLLRQRL